MNNFLFENKSILDSVGRCTSFTVIYWCQYPDDIDKDRSFLFKFLSFCGVPCVCSPVHDQDVNELDTNTGLIEFKKPHFHLAFDFGSGQNKTVKQCFELIEPIREFISIAPFDRLTSINEFNFLDQEFEVFDSKPDLEYDPFIRCCKVWKKGNVVRNMRSLLRYFCHLDNPEKHQYSSSEFHTFNGFNLDDRLYSQSDSLILLDEILDFVEREEVYSFWQLLSYCRKNNREWFSVLCRNQFSNLIINAIKSFTYDNTGALDRKVEHYENPNRN